MTAENAPLDKFTIDLAAVENAKNELDEKMNTLNGQISRMISKVEVDDMPVLLPILNLTHERKMLEKIARALTRIAPMMEEYEKLGRRKHLLEVAAEEPGWLAATLGDFTDTFNVAGADGWEWEEK